MKNRRAFLRRSGASLLSLGSLSAMGQQAPLNPPPTRSAKHGYVITNGPRARKKPDGSWKFSTRIINLDDRERDIFAFLQISTDRGFNQIIASLPVHFKKEKSYICSTNYHSKLSSTKLFFRYSIDEKGQAVPAVEMIVGSISPWDDESRGE
jgi:hypothetical protein